MPGTQDKFVAAMTDVFVAWASTFAITEYLTEFHEWLESKPELWQMFSECPDEDTLAGGVQIFMELAMTKTDLL